MTSILGPGDRLPLRTIARGVGRLQYPVAHVAWSDAVLGAYGASACDDDAYLPYVESLGIDWREYRPVSAIPGRRRDGTPVVVVTCAPVPRRETRTYSDRADSIRRQARARARGFAGAGALDRYRAALLAGDPIAPAAPEEDVAWARASATTS